jgi:DNA-nicking Smr family endonuclease
LSLLLLNATKIKPSNIKPSKIKLDNINLGTHIAVKKPDNEDIKLFLEAVKDVIPLPAKHAKVRLDLQQDKPRPVPKRFKRDDQQALADSLSDHFIPAYELEAGAPITYLSAGHSPEILVKLRRGHWPVQAAIDLHGMISDDARLYISTFIGDCKSRGIRCVRIVHGKGLSSRNQEPVLKNKLRGWLMQKNEIIAYVEAKKQDGGSGAVIVLIKA